jgi:hypothetical protein
MLKTLIDTLGPLRTMLCAGILVVVALRPWAGGAASYSGWSMVPTLIAPALVPLLFFVLLLDMLMSRVFMTDTEGPDRARFRRILWIETGVLALLLAVWGPFFFALGG